MVIRILRFYVQNEESKAAHQHKKAFTGSLKHDGSNSLISSCLIIEQLKHCDFSDNKYLWKLSKET